MFRRKPVVRPGQRYRSAEFGWLEWEVIETFTDSAGRPHARVRVVGDAHTRKTVACALLLDARRFVLTAPTEPSAAAPAPA